MNVNSAVSSEIESLLRSSTKSNSGVAVSSSLLSRLPTNSEASCKFQKEVLLVRAVFDETVF